MLWLKEYLTQLQGLVHDAEVTDAAGTALSLEPTLERLWQEVRASHERGNKLMFIGNGGSAGICSHTAIDYSKNGGVRSMAFNDGAALTCLANDLGFERVFSEQMVFHARAGDILVAISSSGRSVDILNGVKAARERGCAVYTFSGFDPGNPLREMGDTNFYVASHEYGFVELGHQTILHAILDRGLGWTTEKK